MSGTTFQVSLLQDTTHDQLSQKILWKHEGKLVIEHDSEFAD